MMRSAARYMGEWKPGLSVERAEVLGNALRTIDTYRGYLEQIAAQYQRADRRCHRSVWRIVRLAASRTPERRAALDRHRLLTAELHLQIESFYLFSKILLDRVAHLIQYYFGPIRKAPLSSHDKLTKNFQQYIEALDLDVSESFINGLSELRTEVADFRDQHIAHDESPRTQRGTVWRDGEPARLQISRLQAKDTERAVLSGTIPRLLAAVDRHVDEALTMMDRNYDRNGLARASPQPDA